ncbi:MAG: hypothetical protein WBJ29_06505 [Fervidobacterium sp.]
MKREKKFGTEFTVKYSIDIMSQIAEVPSALLLFQAFAYLHISSAHCVLYDRQSVI